VKKKNQTGDEGGNSVCSCLHLVVTVKSCRIPAAETRTTLHYCSKSSTLPTGILCIIFMFVFMAQS